MGSGEVDLRMVITMNCDRIVEREIDTPHGKVLLVYDPDTVIQIFTEREDETNVKGIEADQRASD
ncbi:MAG: hypothetical protein HWN68_17935 [Desulfobacterales bacterium]|nr:hypothetical protein [Desulfobacterales bacterium]